MNSSAQVETGFATLAEVLFEKDGLPVFAILDGASVSELVKRLFEHRPEHCCLYRGELKPDTMAVAPYLVRLESQGEFTDWILRKGWGTHWGIYIVSAANLRRLRNHFREFLKVELPDRRTALFRYYDPRVFRRFLPACTAPELGKLFGPVQSFVVEGETPGAGVKYSRDGNTLKLEPFQLKQPS